MLETLATLRTDLEGLRTKVADDEGDQPVALDRAMQGLLELVSVIEPLVQDYQIRHR
jgi:hypothetical protein